MRRTSSVASVVLLNLALGGCTSTQATDATAGGTPTFWLGRWHGVIAPVRSVISLFSEMVLVYAVPNVGRARRSQRCTPPTSSPCTHHATSATPTSGRLTMTCTITTKTTFRFRA